MTQKIKCGMVYEKPNGDRVTVALIVGEVYWLLDGGTLKHTDGWSLTHKYQYTGLFDPTFVRSGEHVTINGEDAIYIGLYGSGYMVSVGYETRFVTEMTL
jgi:hypothetical protein